MVYFWLFVRLQDSGYMNNIQEGCPITYRELHEEAAGMGLSDEFFKVSNINPDAPVKCNCKFDGGHEPTCDIVTAHELLEKKK